MLNQFLSAKLNQRLKSYAVLAGAAAGTAANAQLVYTDIATDVVIDDVGEFYDLDLNNDGIVDFKIEYLNELAAKLGAYDIIEKGIGVEGFGKSNRFLGKRMGKFLYSPYVIADGEIIPPYGDYQTGKLFSFTDYFYFGSLVYEDQDGAWYENQTDKFIGLSFMLNGNMCAGWLRLDFSLDLETENMSATLKDYAYKQIPYSPIITGVTELVQLPAAENILAEDIGNNFNASDLQVTWDAAADETNIDTYYLIVVRTDQLGDLTLDEVVKYDGGNGREIPAIGAPDYTYSFGVVEYDLYGDLIVPGISYTAVVLSMDEDFLFGINQANSDPITLNIPATAATNVVATDISDNLNASDLQVNFTLADDESVIDEYRVMIVPESGIALFDSAAAAIVIAANYTTVAKTGSDLEIILDAAALTYLGNPINQNTNYHAFAVSVLSGGAGFIVSAPSNQIALHSYTPVMTALVANDVGDNGNIKDLELSALAPASFAGISQFYLNFIQASMLEYFAEDDLINFSMFYHSTTEFTPGERDTLDLTGDGFDVFYNPIKEGVEYYAYIVSNPSGALYKKRSEMVSFTLLSPISAIEEVSAAIIPENNNASDILIIADKYDKEDKLTEYRIMAVPAADAGTFNLAAANAVAAGNYLAVTPNGMDLLVQLSSDFRDVDGNLISASSSYTFFILSIANETANNVNALSPASNSVRIFNTTDMNIVKLDADQVYAVNNDIHINVPELSADAKMYVFDMLGKVIGQYSGLNETDFISIDKSTLGIYMIRIVDNKQIYTGKVLLK